MPVTVNDREIEDEVIEAEVERLRPDYERAFQDMDEDDREAQLYEWARENVIEKSLLVEKATEETDPVDEETLQSAYEDLATEYGGEEALFQALDIGEDDVDEVKEEIELQIRVDRLMDEVTSGVEPPSEEEIEQYYEEHKEDFMTQEQVRAAHIVKHVDDDTDRDTAKEIIEKADATIKEGTSFEQAALEYSDCPENSGDLGYFPRGEMVQKFEDVVFSMEEGEISDVFETPFGFHIAKVYDHQEAAPKPLEEVRDEIEATVLDEKRNQAIEEYIDDLKETAQIDRGE